MSLRVLVTVLVLLLLVASSGGDSKNHRSSAASNRSLRNIYSATQGSRRFRNLATNFSDLVMYGLAGIPIIRAFQYMAPLVMAKGTKNKDKHKKRNKRDLEYAKQLLDLLLAVEAALEKYGITEPQCQLRATCEVFKKGTNEINPSFERNFKKLIGEMRREMKNPRVVPLAKYVFEYYDEAATRGETQCDCGKIYSRCPHALSHFMNRTKSKIRQSILPRMF